MAIVSGHPPARVSGTHRLLAVEDGMAAKVLRELGLHPRDVRERTEKLLPPGAAEITMGQIPFTPGAKKALERALAEASGLGQNYMGTEHLLLGLLGAPESIAGQALREMGVRVDEAQECVLHLLGCAPSGEDGPEPTGLDAVIAELRHGLTEPAPCDWFSELIVAAREEALRFRHGQVSPAHLLLALLGLENSTAGHVLRALGTEPSALRREIGAALTIGTDASPEPRFNSGFRCALEYTAEEARELGADLVGSEHVLLGLLRWFTEGGRTPPVLLDAAREQVRKRGGAWRGGSDDMPPWFSTKAMFDRFTDPARKAMGHARTEAIRLRHDSIGSEHVLLGLLATDRCTANRILDALKIEPKGIREAVAGMVGPGTTMVTMGQLPLTPRGKLTLQRAYEEARALDHDHIGTGHLLLGLLAEWEGIGALALNQLGVDLETARKCVIDLDGTR